MSKDERNDTDAVGEDVSYTRNTPGYSKTTVIAPDHSTIIRLRVFIKERKGRPKKMSDIFHFWKKPKARYFYHCDYLTFPDLVPRVGDILFHTMCRPNKTYIHPHEQFKVVEIRRSYTSVVDTVSKTILQKPFVDNEVDIFLSPVIIEDQGLASIDRKY